MSCSNPKVGKASLTIVLIGVKQTYLYKIWYKHILQMQAFRFTASLASQNIQVAILRGKEGPITSICTGHVLYVMCCYHH